MMGGMAVSLAGGASSLITDCTVEYGNPAGSDLAPKMIARHNGIFGRPPRNLLNPHGGHLLMHPESTNRNYIFD